MSKRNILGWKWQAGKGIKERKDSKNKYFYHLWTRRTIKMNKKIDIYFQNKA